MDRRDVVSIPPTRRWTPNMALQRTRGLVVLTHRSGAGSTSAVEPSPGGRSPLNAVALGAVRISVALSLGFILACASAPPSDLNSVSGLVVDDRGIRLPGSIVKLIQHDVVAVEATASSPDGEYSFRGIRSGHYQIVTSLPGFETPPPAPVILAGGSDVRADVIRLRPSTLSGPVAADDRELRKAQNAVLHHLWSLARKKPRHYVVAEVIGKDWKAPAETLVQSLGGLAAVPVLAWPDDLLEAFRASGGDSVVLAVMGAPDAAADSLVLFSGAFGVDGNESWYRMYLRRRADEWVVTDTIKLIVIRTASDY